MPYLGYSEDLIIEDMAGSVAPDARNDAFADTIRSIPRGKVASYGQIAAAAGYPRHHRAVARLLKTAVPGDFPWHRVVGANGEIKVTGRAATEQRLRLKREGVRFIGNRVDFKLHRFASQME